MRQQRAKVQSKGLASFQSSQLHMQMVGAGGAAPAHPTDGFTGAHQATGFNVSTLQVGIHGLPPPTMLKQHGESITADRLHQLHPSGKHGQHGCGGRSNQVMADMHTPALTLV